MSLRPTLLKLKALLEKLAPITPIKSDDALVLLINAVLADAQLFGWLESKVDQPEGTLSLEGEAPVALQSALELRGLNWGQVLSALPVLLELIRLLRAG